MDKAAKKIAAETLEETLKRRNVSYGTTFPVSIFRSKTSRQVLYLEAGKDFVDTLLSFLLLPVGTIIHLLSTGIQVTPALGGISSIFESVQNFSPSDLQLALKKDLVQPRPAAIGCACKSSGLPMQVALEMALILPSPRQRQGLSGEYHKCNCCQNLASTSKGSACAPCKARERTWAVYSEGPYSVFSTEPDRHTGGFVTVNTTFIVTDNLQIMPLTTMQSVSVLSRLKVASLADLEGNNIAVSLRQILQLLHSSLGSNTCLNDVFGTTEQMKHSL